MSESLPAAERRRDPIDVTVRVVAAEPDPAPLSGLTNETVAMAFGMTAAQPTGTRKFGLLVALADELKARGVLDYMLFQLDADLADKIRQALSIERTRAANGRYTSGTYTHDGTRGGRATRIRFDETDGRRSWEFRFSDQPSSDEDKAAAAEHFQRTWNEASRAAARRSAADAKAAAEGKTFYTRFGNTYYRNGPYGAVQITKAEYARGTARRMFGD